jgi:alpha,alpha-trehalase
MQRPLRALLRAVAASTFLLLTLASTAQETPQPASTSTAPDPAATLDYIHKTWDVLSRSMSDCHSLVDIKITTHPVLYLPAGMTTPAAVKALTEKCGVRIAFLPHLIAKIGDVMPEDAGKPGLLYLPNAYIVPGGRFNEMYGWDSYFIVLGLIADHREALAKGMVDNFFFEIDHYGGVLNANRTYYLTRSQPPFLTSMIRAVYEDPASFPNRTEAQAWLEHGYAMASRDYETWTRPEHRAGTTGLARYYDYGEGPVPEMEDDSTYYADVIRWLVAHPKENPGFLIKGSANPDEAEADRLKKTSCDVTRSKVCLRAEADGFRLSRDFYKGDRAMRESGFDPSFRFEAFSGDTHHYAPVGLNSLLFRYERDMAHFAHLLGKPDDAHQWELRAKRRDIDMHRFLWQPKAGAFGDFDFTRARASSYVYITSLYPLWAGVATREEAVQMESKLSLLERQGGLMMSTTNTGLQWDDPYGWAPTNWIAVSGLDAYQFRDDAKRISKEFTATIDRGLATDGTIREKYNMEAESEKVQVAIGYKSNEVGFGWTNAVYLKMKELISEK